MKEESMDPINSVQPKTTNTKEDKIDILFETRELQSLTDDDHVFSSLDDASLLNHTNHHEQPQSRRQFAIELLQTIKAARHLFLLLFLFALAFGSTVGVVPDIMADRYARLNHGYDDSIRCWIRLLEESHSLAAPSQACREGLEDAQQAAAYTAFVSNLLTFVTSSVVGSSSDENGRRVMIILGISLSCIAPIMVVSMELFPSMSPIWYYIANGSTGLINWLAVALSSIADILRPQYRASGFGLILACFSLGFALSPMIGATFNHIHASLFCCITLLMAWINTICFLPETLPEEAAHEAKSVRNQRNADRTTLQTIKAFITRPIQEISILNRNRLFRLLSILAFFSGMVSSADQTILIYYVKERLLFDNHDIAKMFIFSGILGIFVQCLLIKPFIDSFGERLVIVIAFISGFIQNYLIGIAWNKSIVFASIAFSSLCAMSFPTISSIKSMNVKISEQGQIQGALYSVQALASGTGPMLMRLIYSWTKEMQPGAMFLAAACLYLLAASFAWTLPKASSNSSLYISQADTAQLNGDNQDSTSSLLEEPLLSSNA